MNMLLTSLKVRLNVNGLYFWASEAHFEVLKTFIYVRDRRMEKIQLVEKIQNFDLITENLTNIKVQQRAVKTDKW